MQIFFSADLATVEKALEIVDNFSSPPGCLQPSKSLVHLKHTHVASNTGSATKIRRPFVSKSAFIPQTELFALSLS